MLYRILADATVVLHLSFIVFVLAGGMLVWRWRKLAWAHLPAFLWGAAIELFGWVCPLTYLENHFRAMSSRAGYATGFVEHYLMPLIYPDLLFPGGFPRVGFVAIGVFVLIFNAVIYWRVWKGRGQGIVRPGSP
ncbi:MAG: DUF2784 domain-containing protein [Alphaproteobacteria bacterium]|nr:DUF2784 domain-containing protein [Alphaproteobacteria bacterium]